MFKWIKKLSGDTTAQALKEGYPLVEQINALEAQVKALSDEEMRSRVAVFRQQIVEDTAEAERAVEEKQAQLDAESHPDQRIVLRDELRQAQRRLFHAEQDSLNSILIEAFALVREAAVRTIGQRHYDVQLLGGIVLHRGQIAEMRTGEGKTLSATLPLYLNALVGRGVQLVTVNDYLARRDCGWMGQIFYLLGLSTAVIIPDFSGIYDPNYTEEHVPGHDERLMHLRPCSRHEAYGADILYGTNNEFGFDYLRDNMTQRIADVVQRTAYYAIVDEVDNILIDESRTPLIISAPDVDSYQHYLRFARVVHVLGPSDYEIEEKDRVVTLTEEGVDRVERQLDIDHDQGESLYDENHAEMTFFLEAALKSRFLYKKDVDYVVQDGLVVIVDVFTGRLMSGRRWSDGIHESIEAKEKVIYREPVEVQRESKTFATITFQNYFRLYEKLAGMTGTAATEQEEFFKIYRLEVVVVPTHRPTIRADYTDRIYARTEIKFEAVVREIAEKHERGQPMLVGTTSVELSEYLSRLLKRKRIPHEVLNAKNHEREALIVSKAGLKGAVTIATNMAGRGTDVELAPGVIDEACINPETGQSLCCVGCGYDCATCFKTERFDECAKDVRCGLHVIGTERHEARRVDNQLRGRAGRQGDPGSSRFYVSTEDDLIRRFGPGADRMRSVLERFAPPDDIPIEARAITRMIDQAQVRVEGHHFDVRKHLVEYDDVLNRQREVIYAERRRVLEAENSHGLVLARLREEIADRVTEVFESLLQVKEYERDRDMVLGALENMVAGIHGGRQGREGSRKPLFPIIIQVLVEQMQGRPSVQAYEQLQETYRQLVQGSMAPEDLPAELEEVAEIARGAALEEIAAGLSDLGASLNGAGPQEIAARIESPLLGLQVAAAEVLQAELAGVLDAALAYRQERVEEIVGRTLAQYLYEESEDESDRHLSLLYRTVTRDHKIPLPATVTTSRWAHMEPQEVEEEVLVAVRREVSDSLSRARQHVLGRISVAVQDWRTHGGAWWTVGNLLGDLDYFYRLPPYIAAEPLAELSQEEIEGEVYLLAHTFLLDREKRISPMVMRQIERGYLLRAIDKEWVDYLTAMEDLRQGIGLQAYGQRDPLVEYRRRSYHLFERLLERMREQALFYIFRASQAPVVQRAPLASGPTRPARSGRKKESKKARRKKKRSQQSAGSAEGTSGTTTSASRRRRRRKKR